MSIETRIQAINDHLIDDYKVLRLAGADLTGVNKNILNLKPTWKERLLYFMNNGTDIVWNNWNKVSGSGTTLSINGTVQAPMSLVYKGQTSQTGTPTPTSPIPVQVVSGDNTITVTNSDNTQSATYPINLGDIELCKIGTYQDKIDKSTGKNLLNPNDTFNEGTTIFSIANVKPNTTYYCKAYNTGEIYTGAFSMRIKVNGIWQIGTARQLVTGFSYTTPDNCTAIAFNGLNDLSKRICMINEGTTPLEYEPYGTGWYLKKEIGKVVLDENTIGFYKGSNYSQIYSQELDVDKYQNQTTALSNRFIYVYNNNYGSFFVNSTKRINFLVDTSITTLEQAKAWVSNNEVEAYYILKTPTYDKITDTTLLEQLEAMKQSYESVTNISQVNNDLPFELNITALSNE